MNIFIIQIALLFFPGILWERIHASYSLKNRPEQFDIIRRSFMMGVAAYAVTYLIYAALRHKFSFVSVESDKPFLNIKIAREVFYTSIVATVCAFLHVKLDDKRLLSRVLLWLRVTKHYGPEDLWDYVFSQGDATSTFVHLRDFEKQIIYAGWVRAFSETDKLRELWLERVIVYSFEGDTLFQAPRVYIARDRDNIDLEFPATDNSRTEIDYDRPAQDDDGA